MADIGTTWNVSSINYEYWLYFMPSNTRGGNYRVNVELQQVWEGSETETEYEPVIMNDDDEDEAQTTIE